MRISDWSSDVCSSDLAAKLKERLDAARLELDQAQRGGDLARAGELSYGTIPQLQKQLADAEGTTKGAMLREEVTDDDIAAVVSRWTGIPVDRMLQGERVTLLAQDGGLAPREIGRASWRESLRQYV